VREDWILERSAEVALVEEWPEKLKLGGGGEERLDLVLHRCFSSLYWVSIHCFVSGYIVKVQLIFIHCHGIN